MATGRPLYWDFDPVAIALGPLKIHWYGIAYLLAFATFLFLARRRAHQRADWNAEEVHDLLFYGALGVILGGRLGYVLFYDLGAVLANPFRLFMIWRGGMSFHGGLLGVMVAIIWFASRTGRRFIVVADFVVPLVPPGLFFGRIANFIGGELWGRLTDVPWGVVFPKAIDPINWASPELRALWASGDLNDQARHPSQLYQAGLEGLALFALLWYFSRRPRPAGAVSGLFLIGYGSFRIFLERFRQPDEHIDFIAFGWLTMGQALSIPMVLAGAVLMVLAYRNAGRDH